MIARLLEWLGLSPRPAYSPTMGALRRETDELLAGQRLAMCNGGAPGGSFGGPGNARYDTIPGIVPEPDCFVFDGAAMAQRLTLTLPLELAGWIDAERGNATREEFVLGRLYIARILGDLEHSDLTAMREASRTHGVAEAIRKGTP